jgi:hypothetical protein
MTDRNQKLARLVVRFHRDGREIESERASSGERALKIGLLVLARLDDLQVGDRLDRRGGKLTAPISVTGRPRSDARLLPISLILESKL